MAVCVSTLLYGAKCWLVYRRPIKMLEAFHSQCLMKILNLKWWHKVFHTDMRRRAGMDPLEVILEYLNLRWGGHVLRMPENRHPLLEYFMVNCSRDAALFREPSQ